MLRFGLAMGYRCPVFNGVALISMNVSNYFPRHARSAGSLMSGLVMALGLAAVPGTSAFAQAEVPLNECNQFAESVNRNQTIMATFEQDIETFSTNASLAET